MSLDNEKQRSALGLASILTFSAGIVIGMVMIIIGFMVGSSRPRSHFVQGSAEANFIIGGLITWATLNLASFGLGIAGLCQQERRKGFAICGTALSSLVMLAVLACAAAVLR